MATEMIEINLQAPNTPEEQLANIVGNVTIGSGANAIDYVDQEVEDEVIKALKQFTQDWPPIPLDYNKPKVCFYAVGPSTKQIRCPLCQQRGDVDNVHLSGISGTISCVLSVLSCCFPLFFFCYVFNNLQTYFKAKRLFCNKCGGHVGFYRRAT